MKTQKQSRSVGSGRVGRREVDLPPLQKLFLSSGSPPSPHPVFLSIPATPFMALWLREPPPPPHPLAVSAATPQPRPCHSSDSRLTPAAGRVSPAELESRSRCCRTEQSL